jgi:hypothetical protein
MYGLAAAEASVGRIPGAYVSLVVVAPIGLLANNISHLVAVVQKILPTRLAVSGFIAAIVGSVMFQAAVTQRASKTIIVILALANLSLFAFTGIQQKRLRKSELQLQCLGQDKMATLLRSGFK